MKSILFTAFLLGATLIGSAQVITNCTTSFTDTVKYVEQAKTSSLAGISINTVNDGGSYGYAGFGQRFEAPDSVKLVGFNFKAWVYSGSAGDTVVCRLFKANGAGMPDVQIDSVIHTVPLIPGFISPLTADTINNTVMFPSSHVLEGDYILTVENFASSDMYTVRNIDGDGAGEDLCLTYYRGLVDPTYDGWYSTFSFGAGWNFDMNFQPIVEYSLETELTLSSDSICLSDTLSIMDTLLVFDDSILFNRMYNPNYASYIGYTTSSSYDYGDGNTDANGSHVYSANGNFTIMVTDTVFATGWTNNNFLLMCNDDVFVSGAYLGEDTTMCMQSSIVLYPGEFDSYSWNTGQLTDSIIAGPILNPGVITYTVDVTSSGCNSSASITINFENCVGLDENLIENAVIYPNPVSSQLTIELENSEKYDVKLIDVQGKLVLSESLSGSLNSLDLSGFEEGTYILSISNNNKVVRKKLQILR